MTRMRGARNEPTSYGDTVPNSPSTGRFSTNLRSLHYGWRATRAWLPSQSNWSRWPDSSTASPSACE